MATEHDFTQGRILRQLIVFSGPIIGANLLQTSYQFADSLWIGNLLGADALGSVAVSAVVVFTTLSFVIGMTNASLAILSQLRGREDPEGLSRYLNAFIVTLFSLAIVLGVGGFLLSESVLDLLGTPAELMTDAREYLQVSFLGIIFLFGYNFISTVLRALGDSRTPLRFVAISVVLNIVLDPIFIHTFGFGVKGAAVATVLSQGFAFLYGLVHLWRARSIPLRRPTRPAWTEVRTIFALGLPAGMQMAVISAGSAAVMSVVTGFGGSVVGGFGAAQRLDALIMVPAQALGIAASSMVGQNIGAGNWRRVSAISRTAVLYNLAVMISIALVLVILAPHAIRLFVRDEASVAFGARYLRTVALFYPFLGINFVLNGSVRASGAMYQVLVLNFVSFWVLRFPLTSFFADRMGESGIGVGIATSFVISSAAAFAYFRWGRWRDKDLFDDDATSTDAPAGASPRLEGEPDASAGASG